MCPLLLCQLYRIYLHSVCPSHSAYVCAHRTVGSKSLVSSSEVAGVVKEPGEQGTVVERRPLQAAWVVEEGQ